MEHLLAHIKGIAADMLPLEPDSVNEIKECLMKKIVYDTSSVVKGKLMALRADRNNLSDFSKKVENLGIEFQRALVLEGIPFSNANRMVIDSTIDLCRANTNSQLVKSGLIGASFSTPKEVVAKYVIETRKDGEEKKVLAIRQTSSNSKNFGNNFQRRSNFNRNFQGNGNYNRNYNNFHSQNSQNGSRGNFRGGNRGRGSYHRGRGNRQGRTYYATENGGAPPSGAAQAQQVQTNQADH